VKRRAVFFDRDGTLNQDLGYVGRVEDLILIPEAIQTVKELNENEFLVIVISNQSGVARGFFSQKNVEAIHQKIKEDFLKMGAAIDAFYYCPHHPDEGCCCRKPSPKMVVTAAKRFQIDLGRSYFVGDKLSDVKTGLAAGCKTVLLKSNNEPVEETTPQFQASNLTEAIRWILEDSQK